MPFSAISAITDDKGMLPIQDINKMFPLKPKTSYIMIEHEEYEELLMRSSMPSVAFRPPEEHKHTSEGYESCAECKEKVRAARIKNNHHAISNMERALSTYRDRNRVYGNNYKRFGIIMHSLYPKGVDFSTPEQWNRFGIILQMISKLSRYVTDPAAGHIDSVHDMGVYAFMLEELDAEQAGLDVLPPIPLTTVLRDVGPKDVLPGACEHVYKYPCDKYPNKADQCNPAGMPGVIHKCGVLSCTNCGANPEAK
jgi:hypothetical protein